MMLKGEFRTLELLVLDMKVCLYGGGKVKHHFFSSTKTSEMMEIGGDWWRFFLARFIRKEYQKTSSEPVFGPWVCFQDVESMISTSHFQVTIYIYI